MLSGMIKTKSLHRYFAKVTIIFGSLLSGIRIFPMIVSTNVSSQILTKSFAKDLSIIKSLDSLHSLNFFPFSQVPLPFIMPLLFLIYCARVVPYSTHPCCFFESLLLLFLISEMIYFISEVYSVEKNNGPSTSLANA